MKNTMILTLGLLLAQFGFGSFAQAQTVTSKNCGSTTPLTKAEIKQLKERRDSNRPLENELEGRFVQVVCVALDRAMSEVGSEGINLLSKYYQFNDILGSWSAASVLGDQLEFLVGVDFYRFQDLWMLPETKKSIKLKLKKYKSPYSRIFIIYQFQQIALKAL